MKLLPFATERKLGLHFGAHLNEAGSFKDRQSTIAVVSTFLSVCAQSLLILFSLSKLPPQIPFFYSVAWGDAMLAAPLLLWSFPAVVIGFFIMNTFFINRFAGDDIFLRRVFSTSSVMISFVTLYGTFKIIFLLT